MQAQFQKIQFMLEIQHYSRYNDGDVPLGIVVRNKMS